MPAYPPTDYPTQQELDAFKQLFPGDPAIQGITLDELIDHVKTLDTGTVPPTTSYHPRRADVAPCTMAIAELAMDCVFSVFDIAAVAQTGVDNAVSDAVLNAIAPRIGPKQNLVTRLANIVRDPDSTTLQRAAAVIRIIFAVEALGLVATIVEQVYKKFDLLSGAFFAIKLLAKLTLALATDGTSLIIGSIVLLVDNTGKIVVQALKVRDVCGTAEGISRTAAGGTGQGPGLDQIGNPGGLAVDAAGNLYVGDVWEHRVLRFAPGATDGVVVIKGDPNNVNDPATPEAMAIDGNGNIYLACTHLASVHKWAPGATAPVMVAGGPGVGGSGPSELAGWDTNLATMGPTGIAVDAAGNLYVVDASNNRVQKFPPGSTAGTAAVTVAGGIHPGSAGTELNAPYGVAVDGDGNVYVTDRSNGRVQKWAPGATTGVTIAGGSRGSRPDQLDWPLGVAVDAWGNVYVSDSTNDRVQLWEPGVPVGVPVAGDEGRGAGPDQLHFPTNLALQASPATSTSPAGLTLYISDQQNSRIQAWVVD